MVHFSQTKTILILSAIPKGLRLDVEVREIEEAIRRSRCRDRFEIKSRFAVRPRDFQLAIAEEKPYILHFCGHGLKNGGLLLEDNMGNSKSVTPSSLADLFKLHVRTVHCVLLNACHTETTAKAISEHIPYVIGMNQAIHDKSAIAFSQGFYDALGADERMDHALDIERAFDSGKVSISLEGEPGQQTPTLVRRFLRTPHPIFPPRPPVEPFPSVINEVPHKPLQEVESWPLQGGYTLLRQYLESGLLKQADQETARIILTLTKRIEKGWFRNKDIQKISRADFERLDRLWMNLSGDRFGFMAQWQIWLSIGAKPGEFNGQLFRKFSDLVGWRGNEGWRSYDSLNFSKSAPVGHLPTLKFIDDQRNMNSLDIWSDTLKYIFTLSTRYF